MSKIFQTTLGECTTIIPGVLPQEKKGKDLLSYTAVLPGQLTVRGLTGEFGTVLRDVPCADGQFLLAGDVLIKRLNPDCAVVYPGGNNQIVPSANVFAIRPGEKLDSNYLAFLLEKSKLLQRITQLSGIGTTVAAITAPQIAGGVIPLPPLEEQLECGRLWALGKRKDELLRNMLFENDRLLRALCGKLYQ